MRRYTVSVNHKSHVIDVEAVSADSFRVQVNGRLIDVRLDEDVDLAQAAITPQLETRDSSARPAAYIPSPVPDDPAAMTPLPSPSAPPSAPAVPSGPATSQMTAPMPGVILTVDVAVGTKVNAGDALMVLEAMKMKNPLHASRSGVVAEIYVAAGQQVKYGEALLRYEEN